MKTNKMATPSHPTWGGSPDPYTKGKCVFPSQCHSWEKIPCVSVTNSIPWKGFPGLSHSHCHVFPGIVAVSAGRGGLEIRDNSDMGYIEWRKEDISNSTLSLYWVLLPAWCRMSPILAHQHHFQALHTNANHASHLNMTVWIKNSCLKLP